MEKTITLTYDEYQILQNQSKLFEQIRDNDQICICLDHSTKRSFTIKGYDETLKELSDTVNENGTKLERLTWDNAQLKIHVKKLDEDYTRKLTSIHKEYAEQEQILREFSLDNVDLKGRILSLKYTIIATAILGIAIGWMVSKFVSM